MSDRKINTLGFVGLGVMGEPMAGHLLKSGLRVLAYNRSPAKTQAWRARFPQGETCASLEQLANEVDVVSLCVGNDNDVRETVRAMLPHLKAGAVVLDHTTTSSALAQEMANSPSCVAVTRQPLNVCVRFWRSIRSTNATSARRVRVRARKWSIKFWW